MIDQSYNNNNNNNNNLNNNNNCCNDTTSNTTTNNSTTGGQIVYRTCSLFEQQQLQQQLQQQQQNQQQLLQDYDIPITRRPTKTVLKKIYAKAIYDNIADIPDELAFKKGDTLTVLEQDLEGLNGWWLCTLRGRQGICPGNRLRILNSYDSGCFSPSPSSSPCPSSLGASTATLNSSILSSEIYEHPSSIASGVSNCSGGGMIMQTSLPYDKHSMLSNNSINSCSISLNGSINGGYNGNNSTNNQIYSNYNNFNNLNNNNNSSFSQKFYQGKRRSWHITPHKVITPQKCGDIYLYDILPTPSPLTSLNIYQNFAQAMADQSTYDIPKPATPVQCETPTGNNSILKNPLWIKTSAGNRNDMCPSPSTPIGNLSGGCGILTPTSSSLGHRPTMINDDSYDIPKSISIYHQQQNMTPSSSNSSLLTSDSLSLSFSSSNRSSMANMPDYDIPKNNPVIPIKNSNQSSSSLSSTTSTIIHNQHQHSHQYQHQQSCAYDSPQQQKTPQYGTVCKSISSTPAVTPLVPTKELPLELPSALETLATLQTEATTAITRVLGFVTSNWREAEKLEPILMDLKLAIVRLKTALHDLAEFCEGALGNASRSDDKSLIVKLKPLVIALRAADKLLHESTHKIEMRGWTVESLERVEQKHQHQPDSLDQLIACAQTLTEDVRQSTSFIQGNAPLLFKRIPTKQPVTPTGGLNNSNEWVQDYDYVSFESKDSAAKKNSELREAIPSNLKNKFDNVLKNAEANAMNNEKLELDPNDKLVVKYYAAQITTHMGYLTQAIDSFLDTVEKNQPPKYFIAFGKFVVLSAHNLVGIGDIVHRNVSKQDLKSRIEQYTDSLAEALKTCVLKSKKAAQHFPSVVAVQEMVDSVVDISHLAYDLKVSMLQAVQT